MIEVVGARRPRVLLLGDTRIVGHHGSSSVVRVILHELNLRGVDIVSSGAAGFGFDLASAGSFDGVVMNAEGALHGRNVNALRIARVARQAREMGVPCFILNAVVDECHQDVIEGLRAATAVFCRERRSLERANAYGAAATLCPDVTFALDVSEVPKWTPGERVIVTDSTVASANRILHGFARRTNAQFLPMRTRPEVPLLSSRKAFVRIVKFETRHQIGKLLSGSFIADRFGCAVATPDAFLRTIADCVRLVVSGRFHGVCLCMKLGVPFVALRSNTYKVEGILEDARLSHKLIDIDMLRSASNLDALLAAGAWSAADEARRRDYVAAAQMAITGCFDEVAARAAARRSQ